MFKELGERLRSYRVDTGLQVAELAARTRIASKHIQALEDGRLDLLPGIAFVKGFIRSICAELDRDPEPLLEIIIRSVELESPEEINGSPDRRKFFPLLLSIGILLALIIGGVLIHGGGEKPPEIEYTEESAAPGINTPATAEEDSFSSSAAQSPDELDLIIRATQKTWLRIQADSSQPWETTMKTGDEIRLKAMDRINLFIGNAGGILFELNGKRFGPPGSMGQVISDYVITRDNL
jgi:cytoskeletal protein RodZ